MRLTILFASLLFALSKAQTDYFGYPQQRCSGTAISTDTFSSNVLSQCAALCSGNANCEYFTIPYCATCPEDDEERKEEDRVCTTQCVTGTGDATTWTTYQVDASGQGECKLFTAAECNNKAIDTGITYYEKMTRSNADGKDCDNPTASNLVTRTGCETMYPTRFCNFRATETSGKCSLCPVNASPARAACNTDWTEYKTWKSQFACAGVCEDPNRVITPKPIISDWDTTTYGQNHPLYTAAHCSESPLQDAHGNQVDSGVQCCNSANPDDNLCQGQYQYKYGEFTTIYTDACKTQTCVDTSGHCSVILDATMNNQPCTLPHVLEDDNTPTLLPGKCYDGQCILTTERKCEPGQIVRSRGLNECNSGSTKQMVGRFTSSKCITPSNDCLDYGPGLGGFNAYVISPVLPGGTLPYNSENVATHYFLTQWKDALGRCVVGENGGGNSYHGSATDCQIHETGTYDYNGMDLTYVEPQTLTYYDNGNNQLQIRVTIVVSELLMMQLTPRLYCTGGSCVADFDASWEGQKFCGAEIPYCEEGTTTSHGDPIIWTFDNECYDLNQDGLYVASEARMFDHTIKVAVYNDYMRAIQVVNKKTGEIMLSMNTNGEVMNNNYPYYFKEEVKDCPEDMKKTECPDQYTQFEFDAQDFRYYVQVVRHDYADPGLKEGELGYHLDIYPKPYKKNWAKHKGYYTGLYFENPLPEELPYCPGGSPRTRSN